MLETVGRGERSHCCSFLVRHASEEYGQGPQVDVIAVDKNIAFGVEHPLEMRQRPPRQTRKG